MTHALNAVRIREIRLPDDEPRVLAFIDGMQRYEQALEPDRRIDGAVAEEFFAEITARLSVKRGIALIAERGTHAVGWAVVYPEQNELYVVPAERTFAYISELYVEEVARGAGVGQLLIAACEDWARKNGLGVIMIGVLPGNARADAVYRSAGYATYSLQLRKYLR